MGVIDHLGCCLQVSELELKTLLDESERPPAAVHPDDASSVLPSSVAPQASVPSAAFVEPPLLLKGPPILPRTFDPSAMVTQTPNLADMIQHPLRDSQRAQLARQLTQHYQLLMQVGHVPPLSPALRTSISTAGTGD